MDAERQKAGESGECASIKIILADDHVAVRQAVREWLKAYPDFEVVGEVGDGIDAVKLVQETKPDVLVLDIMMPGVNGIEVARQVKRLSPATSVVMFTMFNSEAYVLEALRSGAKAYVLKADSMDHLVEAIREVAAGRRYLSHSLSERAIDAYSGVGESQLIDPCDSLTTREKEILQLVAQGYTCSEITEKLPLSPRTVETHRSNVMRKLGLHSQAQLIRFAIRKGLIQG